MIGIRGTSSPPEQPASYLSPAGGFSRFLDPVNEEGRLGFRLRSDFRLAAFPRWVSDAAPTTEQPADAYPDVPLALLHMLAVLDVLVRLLHRCERLASIRCRAEQ